MEFIKKFAKEISVFGIIIVIFLALFVYRQMTFKDYTTITDTKLTEMVKAKEDFVVVLGDSSNSTMVAYQDIMQQYTTKNRGTDLYYVDSSAYDKFDDYVQKTFNTNVTYPATLIIKDGKIANKKEGAMQYYSLYDFIKENN